MSEMLQVLVLLCGIDYSGWKYDACVSQSEQCLETTKIKTERSRMDRKRSNTFYKCYTEGTVKE